MLLLLLLLLLGCGSDWKLTRMTQRIILRIRSDMHAMQLQLLLLWLLLLLYLLLLLLMSGAVNETTAFNVLENCKKKFVIHKNKHIKATLCSRLLLTPVTSHPTALPAHLAAAAVVVCARGRQNNFTLLTHFMFIKSADRAD